MGVFNDLKGKRFGRLDVIERASSDRNGVKWLCKCDCGNSVISLGRNLSKGVTTSCGCYRIERVKKSCTTHGHAGNGNKDTTPTYKTWCSMRRRCTDKNHRSHKVYYDKGIKVCESWNTFINFLEDMGERPEGKTIDRIDSDKGYYKENCRWATHKEQANNMSRNRYLEFNGERLTVSQWADKIGVKYVTLNTRIHRGWSVERALTKR